MRLQHAFLAALACAAALASADPIQPGASPAATRQAIQAAIDAAAAQSPAGTVTLGAGTFEIDAQLMITNGVELVGQGWDDTTIRQTANGQRVATLAGGAVSGYHALIASGTTAKQLANEKHARPVSVGALLLDHPLVNVVARHLPVKHPVGFLVDA